METDLGEYIITYYPHLLTEHERIAHKHHLATLKAEDKESEKHANLLMNMWGTKDKDILSMLDDGYDAFKRMVTERILREEPDKVFINHCPNCGKLARTPKAKQCRFCGHDWH